MNRAPLASLRSLWALGGAPLAYISRHERWAAEAQRVTVDCLPSPALLARPSDTLTATYDLNECVAAEVRAVANDESNAPVPEGQALTRALASRWPPPLNPADARRDQTAPEPSHAPDRVHNRAGAATSSVHTRRPQPAETRAARLRPWPGEVPPPAFRPPTRHPNAESGHVRGGPRRPHPVVDYSRVGPLVARLTPEQRAMLSRLLRDTNNAQPGVSSPSAQTAPSPATAPQPSGSPVPAVVTGQSMLAQVLARLERRRQSSPSATAPSQGRAFEEPSAAGGTKRSADAPPAAEFHRRVQPATAEPVGGMRGLTRFTTEGATGATPRAPLLAQRDEWRHVWPTDGSESLSTAFDAAARAEGIDLDEVTT